jgi:sugar phosphate isomerase/epimerase
MHVHDNKLNMDLHLMPYFGVVDWKEYANALKDINYCGTFSLETIPSKKLPDDIFEEMCKVLARIAKEITADI